MSELDCGQRCPLTTLGISGGDRESIALTILAHPCAAPEVIRAFGHDTQKAPMPPVAGYLWYSENEENGTAVEVRYFDMRPPESRWSAVLFFAGSRMHEGIGRTWQEAVADGEQKFSDAIHANMTRPGAR